MDHAPFPLPEGHMFGNSRHPRHHGGQDLVDAARLSDAQRRLRTIWGAKDVEASGVFDGPTIEAVGAVQRAYGLPVTGWLDADTWNPLFAGPPGVS